MENFGGTATQRAPAAATLEERLAIAIERGAEHLLSLQKQEGYWLGELEADTTLESDYIFYLHILGKAERQRIAKLANYVRARQLPDGGWNIYFGGPSELNATIKAYVALKLAGDSVEAPHMRLARERAKALGGLEASNSYVRFYLALVGALDWKMTELVRVQRVRDVIVDARDCDSAIDSVRDQATAEARRRTECG
jgi:squalene-hopene/tetraprenyl-beta-curcumene cyclase